MGSAILRAGEGLALSKIVQLCAVTTVLFAAVASCATSEDNLGATGGSGGVGGGGAGGTPDAAAGSGGSAATGGSGGTAGSGGSGAGEGGVLEGAADAPGCEKQTPDSTCGTWPQCGCDIGQKCDVIDFATGRAICSVEGTALPYQPCFSPGLSCLAGNACIGNVCKPYCDTLADCPGQNRQCIGVQYNDNGVAKPVPGMLTCTSGCDPINPGAICASNLTCSFTSQGNTTDCFPAGSATGPGACTATNASTCAPGYICVNNTVSYDCLKWCRMSNPNDCPTGQYCQGLSSAPVLNGEQYGVCTS